MSVKNSSSCVCSRACSYFCPPLVEVGTTGLKVRRAMATVLTRASQATLAFSSMLFYFQYSEYRSKGPESIHAPFAAKTAAVAATSIYCWRKLSQYSGRIDEILSAPSLSFEEIYEKGFLHRLDARSLQEKFQKMAQGYKGKKFLQLVDKFDLRRLAACGAVKVELCCFESYKLDLKKLGPGEIAKVFPLRLKAWKEGVPKELEEEAGLQQKQYDTIKRISDQFPERSRDLASIFIEHVHSSINGAAVQNAEFQQRGYESALDLVASKNWC